MLQRRPLGERDDLLVCLGRRAGRLSAVVKGSRTARSRVGGLLEPPVELEARLRPGRNLDQLSQPTLRRGFGRLKADLGRLMTAGFLGRLFLACLAEREGGDSCYDLLNSLFLQLEEGRPVVAVGLSAQELLLQELGLAPHLGSCVNCGSQDWTGFAASEGGLLCSACYRGEGFALSSEVGHALEFVRAGQAEVVGQELLASVGRVYKAQFQYHLGLSDRLFRRVLPERRER